MRDQNGVGFPTACAQGFGCSSFMLSTLLSNWGALNQATADGKGSFSRECKLYFGSNI